MFKKNVEDRNLIRWKSENLNLLSFSVCRSINWLIDWLIDWAIDWLIDWLISWWLIGWSIHWLIDWLIGCRSTGWSRGKSGSTAQLSRPSMPWILVPDVADIQRHQLAVRPKIRRTAQRDIIPKFPLRPDGLFHRSGQFPVSPAHHVQGTVHFDVFRWESEFHAERFHREISQSADPPRVHPRHCHAGIAWCGQCSGALWAVDAPEILGRYDGKEQRVGGEHPSGDRRDGGGLHGAD